MLEKQLKMPIPHNFMLPNHRLHSLKNKLDRDPNLKQEYHEILQDYIKKGNYWQSRRWGDTRKNSLFPPQNSRATRQRSNKRSHCLIESKHFKWHFYQFKKNFWCYGCLSSGWPLQNLPWLLWLTLNTFGLSYFRVKTGREIFLC